MKSVEFSLIKSADIAAHVTDWEHRYSAKITTGLIDAIETFWFRTCSGDHFGGCSPLNCALHEDHLFLLSLSWLVFHELNHIDLGHFELVDSFSVAERFRKGPHIFDVRQFDLPHLVPLCLEMQADHEATEMLLGAYIPDDWQELYEKVMAISGMMMLIELEDIKNGAEGRTHPKAATRIFQLLGHLAEMPLIQAQVSHNASLIPNEKELQAFAHEVTIPCFFDAVQLAQTAGAASIADDLGSPEDFFKDLEIAKLGDPSRYGELKTHGAREWAKLWPCNEALKPILGGHFTN